MHLKLIVYELQTELVQEVQTGSEIIDVYAVRPHLYKHLSPSGSLQIEIRDSLGDPIAQSNSVACSSISGASYFHGLVTFDIRCHLEPDTEYQIALIQSGYTFSESGFIGWCNGWESARYPESTPFLDIEAPFDYAVWAYRQSVRAYL